MDCWIPWLPTCILIFWTMLLLERCFYSKVEHILMNGYPAENHYVTTSDGYIINIHRIPSGKHAKSNGKVVLLEHGIWLSSSMWVLTGVGKALGFILADEGYDVWMGNARGNEYSRNHTILNPDTDSEFWNFSWHEIGIYDLKATIDYILLQTNKTELYYVGFSQGSAILHVLSSTIPSYNEKIKAYVNLAPAVFMNHLRSPLFREPATILSYFGAIIPTKHGRELMSNQSFLFRIAAFVCAEGLGAVFCKNIYFFLMGFSEPELNTTLIPTISLHMPAGASSKQYIHFLQSTNTGYFRQYDYGESENVKEYGCTTPPEYDLSKITAPGYTIYSTNDLVVDHIIDVPKLCSSVGNCTGTYLVPSPTFGHLDYLTGNSAPSTVYATVLKFFSQY